MPIKANIWACDNIHSLSQTRPNYNNNNMNNSHLSVRQHPLSITNQAKLQQQQHEQLTSEHVTTSTLSHKPDQTTTTTTTTWTTHIWACDNIHSLSQTRPNYNNNNNNMNNSHLSVRQHPLSITNQAKLQQQQHEALTSERATTSTPYHKPDQTTTTTTTWSALSHKPTIVSHKPNQTAAIKKFRCSSNVVLSFTEAVYPAKTGDNHGQTIVRRAGHLSKVDAILNKYWLGRVSFVIKVNPT